MREKSIWLLRGAEVAVCHKLMSAGTLCGGEFTRGVTFMGSVGSTSPDSRRKSQSRRAPASVRGGGSVVEDDLMKGLWGGAGLVKLFSLRAGGILSLS